MDPPNRRDDRDGRDGRDGRGRPGSGSSSTEEDHPPTHTHPTMAKLKEPSPPQYMPAGLPLVGKNVPMSPTNLDWLFPTTANSIDPPLYTRGLGACQALATYDSATGARSLTHLPGGATTALFNACLAGILTETSTVFIINREEGTKEKFEMIDVPKFKTGIEAALKDEDVVNRPHLVRVVKWVTLWTDKEEDLQRRCLPGSFVLDKKGRYGRAKFED